VQFDNCFACMCVFATAAVCYSIVLFVYHTINYAHLYVADTLTAVCPMFFSHTHTLTTTVADVLNQSSILNASLSSTPGGSTANVFGPYEATPRRPAVDKYLQDDIEDAIHDAGAGDPLATSNNVTETCISLIMCVLQLLSAMADTQQCPKLHC
jgi:hypothetical protein